MKHQFNWRLSLLATLATAVALTFGLYISKHTNEARLERELQGKVQQINGHIDQLQKADKDRKQLEADKKKLQKQIKDLQAKKKAQTVYAAELPQTPVKTTGNCSEWMKQAGIPITAASTKLVLNESGCRPDAVNPSSKACGIPQALPCSKMGCTLADPVCQLRWMNTYVQGRYGTWENALAMWYSRSPHWY